MSLLFQVFLGKTVSKQTLLSYNSSEASANLSDAFEYYVCLEMLLGKIPGEMMPLWLGWLAGSLCDLSGNGICDESIWDLWPDKIKLGSFEKKIHCSSSHMHHFMYAPSQWEPTLHRDIYHWLGAYTKRSLSTQNKYPIVHQLSVIWDQSRLNLFIIKHHHQQSPIVIQIW